MKYKNKQKVSGNLQNNLLDILSQLEDNRRKQGMRHPLHILFLITVMAIMQGAKSERAIARFAINNKKSLINELDIKREEIPSRRILAKFIQNLDFNKLQSLFHTWTMKFVNIKKGEWLSIDGKALKGTITHVNDPLQDFISLVTIFSNKKKIALSVGRINTKKENEVPKVKELIEMLDLQGVTFSLDALHAQTKTVDAIIKSKNNYVIGVKGNQKKLLAQLKKTVKTRKG
jgi:DDE_Tnp_1-associated